MRCVCRWCVALDELLFQKVCLCCPQGCVHGVGEIWSQWRLQSHRRWVTICFCAFCLYFSLCVCVCVYICVCVCVRAHVCTHAFCLHYVCILCNWLCCSVNLMKSCRDNTSHSLVLINCVHQLQVYFNLAGHCEKRLLLPQQMLRKLLFQRDVWHMLRDQYLNESAQASWLSECGRTSVMLNLTSPLYCDTLGMSSVHGHSGLLPSDIPIHHKHKYIFTMFWRSLLCCCEPVDTLLLSTVVLWLARCSWDSVGGHLGLFPAVTNWPSPGLK